MLQTNTTSAEQDPTVADLRRQMSHVRRELHHDFQGVSQQAKRLTDWRHYVQSAPLLSAGVAALAGYLAVPRKLHLDTVDPDDLARLAKKQRVVVESKPKAAAKQGVGSTAFGLLTAMVMRTAISVATQKLASVMSPSTESAAGKPSQPTSGGGGPANGNHP
jgi:hypothetical protein